MELRDVLMIIAILFGPLFATLIALGVESHRRKQEWRDQQKRQILYELSRARAGFNTSRNRELLEASLNAIPIVFHGIPNVIEAYHQAYEAVSQRNPLARQKLVELVKTLCEHVGYKDIDSQAIENIFLFRD